MLNINAKDRNEAIEIFEVLKKTDPKDREYIIGVLDGMKRAEEAMKEKTA